MGRVKGTLVKRVSKECLVKYPDKFTTDFNKNKKVLDQIFTTYKRIRNSIAGYITRLKKREEANKK